MLNRKRVEVQEQAWSDNSSSWLFWMWRHEEPSAAGLTLQPADLLICACSSTGQCTKEALFPTQASVVLCSYLSQTTYCLNHRNSHNSGP